MSIYEIILITSLEVEKCSFMNWLYNDMEINRNFYLFRKYFTSNGVTIVSILTKNICISLRVEEWKFVNWEVKEFIGKRTEWFYAHNKNALVLWSGECKSYFQHRKEN